MGVDRRNLLRAAVAAPAVPLVGERLVGARRAPVPGFDPTSVRFALAVLPDTQYLFDADSADPAPLRETFRYLLDHRAADNIVFLTHLGDVTEHGTAEEFAVAGETFRMIDGKFPYSVLAGNHDINSVTDDQRGSSAYLATFGPDRFRGAPTFLGASADGYNSAHRIVAGGKQWLVLALDWRTSDEGVAWATGVLAANPLPTIVTTHDLAYSDDAGRALLSRNGRRMWDRLIRGHEQIFLTLNGHDWPPGRSVLTNAAGYPVHVHITNYQDRYYGGAGMIRLYHFDLGRNRIDVETFSPWLLSRTQRTPLEVQTIELTGDDNRFSLEIDFTEPRFAATAAARATRRGAGDRPGHGGLLAFRHRGPVGRRRRDGARPDRQRQRSHRTQTREQRRRRAHPHRRPPRRRARPGQPPLRRRHPARTAAWSCRPARTRR